MNPINMIPVFIVSILILTGCFKMIPIYNLKDQPIDKNLTLAQVKKAVELGGTQAGWRLKEIDQNHLIGTYEIRTHRVIVDILFTNNSYSIVYNNSMEMRVFCTEEDKKEQISIATGRDVCPNNAPPMYIHDAYRGWIDELDSKIRAEIIRASYSN